MTQDWLAIGPWTPPALMALGLLLAGWPRLDAGRLWRTQLWLYGGATACALATALLRPDLGLAGGWGRATPLGALLALLVQGLGTVIAAFSARYLDGEPGQPRYAAALAGVLGAVHLLLLADHWALLILAWSAVGLALQQLLCFYADRPFARLAAHKKRLADRLADVLLLAAAGLAVAEVGSGSLSALRAHVDTGGASPALQFAALALVLAVVLRTALLPVHGWLIQVMEAPSPVSALLHAGVVNLGAFVLIRFSPLLEQAPLARALLLVLGLGTAMLAGLVMLTRVSIKVRLAWSTVAQMGFLLLECALGLYSLAALHLIGHSLYKAHAFLGASNAVRQARRQALSTSAPPGAASLAAAPLLAGAALLLVQSFAGPAAWPWWWSAVLALAWAPLLWLPAAPAGPSARLRPLLAGLLMVAGLGLAARLVHALPLGLVDAPDPRLGLVALAGMGLLYLFVALLQCRPRALDTWRRWSYAGFYLDEVYTRLALQLWPARWMPATPAGGAPRLAGNPR